jgi:uncharacterized protein (DUF2141 family)
MGGPKDTLAPKLINSVPFNKQTMVKSNVIILIFDDHITTDKLESELIVTPVMPKKYKVKATNRTVKIKFNEPLKENSTYTLTFRKGITDITENNPAKNLSLVFTTGEKLDSFSIQGTVEKLITHLPLHNTIISIYATDKDTITKSAVPIYETMTNEKGYFKLDNIKDNNYIIYSFVDINNDYEYDPSTEMLSKYFFQQGTEEILKFQLFLQDTKQNKTTNIEQIKKSITTTLSKPSESVKITSIKDTLLNIYYKLEATKLELWPDVKADTTSDTLQLQVLVKDSASFVSIDTIKFPYHYKLNPGLLSTKFHQEMMNQGSKPLYEIETNYPIKTVQDDDIEIKIDKIKYTLKELKYTFNDNRTKIQFYTPNNAKDSIKVKIVPEAITGIYNDTNTFYTHSIKLAEQESKGILAGTIECSFNNYILEILNENFSVKESFYNVKNFHIKNLDPATYIIRLIEDRNANKKWDFYLNNKIDPEKIIYFKEKIIMKANWEINDLLITD